MDFRTSLLTLFVLNVSMLLTACGGGGGSTSDEVSLQMGGAIQNGSLILSNNVSTFAGTVGSAGATDGTRTEAQFNYPFDIATDGKNLYISNNSTVRMIEIDSGTVTTLAGTDGTLGWQDGNGASAEFTVARGITTDGKSIYLADSYNSIIRKIEPLSGNVTTFAGSVGIYGFEDGIGTEASFYLPGGITTDGTNLYVTEPYSHTLRQIVISSGIVTTLAGTVNAPGSADGVGTDAQFDTPSGITTDGANIYLLERCRVRKVVIATRSVSALAGDANDCGSIDGIGNEARFAAPAGITTDGTTLYVTDSNRTVRKISIANGLVTTLVGDAFSLGSSDGVGEVARFDNPIGITTDGKYLYVVDNSNQTIRKID